MKMLTRRATAYMGAVILAVVVLDQLTKAAILTSMRLGERVEVIPGFFNLTLTYNKGAAFGLMAQFPDGVRQWVLGVSAVIALLAVLLFLFRDYHSDLVGQLALAGIVGGALGNIIDRVRIGAVVDFLDVYVSRYHWPAFNIADSAICIGVAVLLFHRPAVHDPEN